ncbi:MAG: hypothetical protein PHE78_06450 [Candidatus Gastranaerophilales bacterium]|nr:hypothetical protein [Candidatus Gastranaerophilales bacterium]
MPQNTDTAQFDPGFAPHLVPFLPTFEAFIQEMMHIKNFGQKKMRYKVLGKVVHKSLLSTLGFWVGCILWGGFIKYSNSDAPKEISGNNFLGLSQDHIKAFAYEEEFEAIFYYLENYSKDMKYYTGANVQLPDFYKTIVEQYREFVALNENFLTTKMTSDIKIPPKFDFLAKYSDSELDKVHAQITQIIQNQDLSGFLELDFLSEI